MASRQNLFISIVAVALLAGCVSDKQPRTTSTESEKVPITTTTPAPAPGPAEPPTPPPPAIERKVIRIDAGSSKPYTDSSGNVWLPDQGFIGGDVVTREDSVQVENTQDPALYRTEHWGMSGFSQAVPNGKYLVKLHFAETYSEIQGPEGRLFGMTVEGQEFSNFDVWAKAGGPRRAYIEEVNVNVADQKLDISFETIADSPEINAIEIIPVQ